MREIPFGRPIIGEEEKASVNQVLQGHILTHGPMVKQFQADFAAFTGAKHAIATASCTASLHLAYFNLGIQAGDEVIVPAQTHVATAHAVELCGGTSVFVDSEPLTGNINLDLVEEAITPQTKAISVVHYLGMPVNMERVLDIAKRHNLFVVEDCALAIGSYYKGIHAGLWGDVGCFSFYPVKHITTGEGGMSITNDDALAHRMSTLRAFGIDRNIVEERKIPGVYDVQDLGLNYRLTEIGAAIGVAQMNRLDGFLAKRRENYAALDAGMREIDEINVFESSYEGYESSHYCYMVVLKAPLAAKRYEIISYLKEHGVGTSIYYPKAVPKMTYYQQKYEVPPEAFPIASRISDHGIALPVGPHTDVEDMTYIIETFKAAIAQMQSL